MEASFASQHTDERGVHLARSAYNRAKELDGSLASPGPQAYDTRKALQSPLTGGIKFSLAKKPPSLFDVPADRICPGPGAYDTASNREHLGVAAYHNQSPRSPRLRKHAPRSASNKQPSGVPRSPFRAASSSSSSSSVVSSSSSSSSRSSSSSQFLFPTAKSARHRRMAKKGAGADGGEGSGLNVSILSDIRNLSSSMDIATEDSAPPQEEMFGIQQGADESLIEAADVGIEPGVFRKIQAKLAAASYMKGRNGGGWGQNRSELFRAADKNKDGFLGFEECKGLFRRVMKLSQNDLSNDKLRALFRRLDVDRTGFLAPEHLFALIEPLPEPMPSSFPVDDGDKDDDNDDDDDDDDDDGGPTRTKVEIKKKLDDSRVAGSQQQQPASSSSSSLLRAPSSKQQAALAVESPAVDENDAAIEAMLHDVRKMREDFGSQLQKLGGFSHILDQLLGKLDIDPQLLEEVKGESVAGD